MTKLEEEKKSKKLAAELVEELEATGQDSEAKAADAVIKIGEEKDREAQAQFDEHRNKLDRARRGKILDYKRLLAEMFDEACFYEEFDQGWRYHIAVTDGGIVMFLSSPDKRTVARAFKPAGNPTYDLVAVQAVIESAWVAINNWQKDQLPKPELILK